MERNRIGHRKYLPHWFAGFGVTMVGAFIEVDFIMYLGLAGSLIATFLLIRAGNREAVDPNVDTSFRSDSGSTGDSNSSDSSGSDCDSSSDSGSCSDN